MTKQEYFRKWKILYALIVHIWCFISCALEIRLWRVFKETSNLNDLKIYLRNIGQYISIPFFSIYFMSSCGSERASDAFVGYLFL